MKAAIFDGREIRIKEIPIPVLKDNQVLIRVKAAGICGTDLAISNGHLSVPIPLILGHEFSGIVVDIDKKVNPNWLKKRVTSEINSNIDFSCFFCQRDIFSQCESRKALGIDINGSFAEFIAVDSYLLHELPDNISNREATFIEPLAAAYQTFETMSLGSDDKTIAIFGLGKLGLLLCQVAIINGLEVIGIDHSDRKLNLAKNFGVKHLINNNENESVEGRIKKITGNLGADIVVDTTGNPNALKEIVSSCRSRGKIHIKSTHGLDTPINLTDIVVREITIYSSRCGPFHKAIDGLSSGLISVKDLISKEFKLEKITDAFNSYKASRDHIKTIILI
ncbi:MAG: alcohol dehydrogenase catalytic domain-containing protein [Candidatus Lokiarchaeota archaeon]|nr:alcohol dehydrogenase catalytic domain-containing protein [Candidatus Lokiarchaeota archaeon]